VRNKKKKYRAFVCAQIWPRTTQKAPEKVRKFDRKQSEIWRRVLDFKDIFATLCKFLIQKDIK